MRFVQWDLIGRPPQCQECLERDVRDRIPVHKRREQRLPCPQHGNPSDLSPRNAVYLQLYQMMPVVAYGTQAARQLDVRLIDLLCGEEWFNLADKKRTYLMLSRIHAEYLQSVARSQKAAATPKIPPRRGKRR